MAINKEQAQVMVEELGQKLSCWLYGELVGVFAGEKSYPYTNPSTAAGIWPALESALIDGGYIMEGRPVTDRFQAAAILRGYTLEQVAEALHMTPNIFVFKLQMRGFTIGQVNQIVGLLKLSSQEAEVIFLEAV